MSETTLAKTELPDDLKCVELDWFDEDELVSVTPRNLQRFQIQKDRAIEILQRAKDGESLHQQFLLLLTRLASWNKAHLNRIERAILTLQDDRLLFVVVQKGVKYDEDFQDELADLDYDVANDPDLNLVRLKTLTLPRVDGDALRSFLDSRLVLVYHGQRTRTHKAGKS